MIEEIDEEVLPKYLGGKCFSYDNLLYNKDIELERLFLKRQTVELETKKKVKIILFNQLKMLKIKEMELNSLKITISNYNNELNKLLAFLKSKTEELTQIKK